MGMGIVADEGGYVDGKERKHHDATHREYATEYLSGDCHWIDVAAEGGGVHTRPPQSCPEIGHHGVGSLLAIEENQTPEIDEGGENHDIRRQKRCQLIARKGSHDDGHCEDTTGKRDETHEEELLGCEIYMEEVDEVEEGDGEEKEDEMGSEIAPPVGGKWQFYEIVGHEYDADPELELHI